MSFSNRKPSTKDLWGERLVVVILAMSGLALFLASTFLTGLLKEILSSVGLSLIGSAAATSMILVLIGSDVSSLRKEINNLGQEVDKRHDNIEKKRT